MWLRACACLCFAAGTLGAARPQLNLNGTWDFYADVGDATLPAITNHPGRIIVPGAWQAQGYGQPGGSIPSSVVGSDLTPAEYLRHNLTARCLYVSRVEVPAEWEGRRVFLCVRRVYRYADVTVNGKQVGDYEGFSSPFEFDVTEAVRFGNTNQFVIGVDNRARKDRDTVGMANYFSNTGGFGGDVYLEARPPEWIQDVFAIPRVADSQVHLQVTVRTANSVLPSGMTLWAGVRPWGEAGESSLSSSGQDRKAVGVSNNREHTADLQITLQPVRLWSPNDPFLYTATVRLLKDGQTADERQVRFGMREIVAKGNKLFLNGKPLFLAGYGDDTTYPLTGMMPWDKEVYLRQLRLMRSLGFNFVRHHSCMPHDEYFAAADEVGMLVQPEASMAYVKFWPKAHGLFEKEWPQIITAFRNHPSIWAWCTGNELFLNDLPERDTNFNAVALSPPVTNGPLKTLDVEEYGVFGPPGSFPKHSHKRSNYYRDVEVTVDEKPYNLLGNAGTTRVFQEQSYELGMKFSSAKDGVVTRVRYFRVPEEQGNHLGHIWDSDGRELARAAFTNESASGWQEAILPEPLPVRANQTYVVSVNANKAYAATAPGASGFTRQDALRIVERAYRQAKELDPTRLIHTSDGGTPQRWTDVVSSGGGEQFGRKPYLLHEYGNYTCSLPDFTLIPRLNGVIRPLTYERAQAYVKQHDLERVYPRLYHSSLAMRADAQKQYLEAARLNEGNAGYSFWLGIDFPESPEGCWDEGILNQFWEPKPGLTNDMPNLVGPTVLVTTVGSAPGPFTLTRPGRCLCACPITAIALWETGGLFGGLRKPNRYCRKGNCPEYPVAWAR